MMSFVEDILGEESFQSAEKSLLNNPIILK